MIEVSHLTKRYGAHTAVSDLSFTIGDGQIYGFLGPNGAGKSTTMNIMTGCLAATSGEVKIDGLDIFEDAAQAKRLLGYLPEQPPLYLDRTPREYLSFVGRGKGLDKAELAQQMERVMSVTQIEDVSDRLIKNLSKGYRQRVGLASAMLGDPEVLILDEPTVGLDPKAHKDILSMIEEVHRLTGNITILVSHNMADVARLSDKILVIDSGHLVVCGTPKEVFSQTEELEKVGLDLPPITRLTEELRKRGMKIEPTILSIDEAAGQIAEYLKARGNG